jgi:hypothetical protein
MIWWFFGSLVVGYCGLVRFDTWYERRRSKVEGRRLRGAAGRELHGSKRVICCSA